MEKQKGHNLVMEERYLKCLQNTGKEVTNFFFSAAYIQDEFIQ